MFSFIDCKYLSLFATPLNQIYHPAGSLINELNVLLTQFHYIFYVMFLNSWKLHINKF